MTKSWRPELVLKDVAIDMIDVIFNQEATITDCEMAISTLIEVIEPDRSEAPFEFWQEILHLRERVKELDGLVTGVKMAPFHFT